MSSAHILVVAAIGVFALAAACGKTVSRNAETLPAKGQGNNSSPGMKDDSDAQSKQSQSTGIPTATISPAPGTGPLVANSPAPGASPAPAQQYVTDGGNVSGFLQDGRIYFAPGISYFYTASFTSSASATTVTGELYFKDAALNPAADLQSYILAGPCSNTTSARYQHIAGNTTPGVSEIHIPLTGSGTAKKGTGTGNFAFRNEPLSWVIEFSSAPGGRFCADLRVSAN